MVRARMLVGLLAASLLVALSMGWMSIGSAKTPAEGGTVVGIDKLKVSGPYAHANLAVYLIHSPQRDDREFITLNEGLNSGKVTVTELENEQVSKLLIENRSDLPLFLQEGDRVTGGKQDRTIQSSLVIAAQSGKQPIPAFCIEQSRWSEGAKGRAFGANFNQGYASNSVRIASKLSGDQGRVWHEVRRQKAQLAEEIGTGNSNSSLNEAIDSEKIVDATKAYQEELNDLLAKHADAIGVAFALDGKIVEVNVFPGHPLLGKVYPRLLETYAVDAAISEKSDKKTKAPTSVEVKQFMLAQVAQQPQRDEKLDSANRLRVFASAAPAEGAPQTFRCETVHGGDLVHLQWFSAEQAAAAPAQAFGGNLGNRQEWPNANEPLQQAPQQLSPDQRR